MKKILIYAGILSCCILILAAFLFIGDFGGFANLLGKESKKVINNDTINNFIGTWDIENKEEQLVFFSNKTCSGFINGKYDFDSNKIFINTSNEISTTKLEYNYFFSDFYETLTLSNVDSNEGLILQKQ